MNRMNIRIWLTASQRRALGIFCYMVLLIAGCAAGTICRMTDAFAPLCQFCIRYGIPCLSNMDGSLFLASMRWNGCILLMSFCLGFCAIGQPFLCTLLVLHGFGLGCLLTGLTDAASVRTLLFPYTLAAIYGMAVSFLLLLGVRESMRLSCVYLKICTQSADAQEMCRRLRMYAVRFVVLLLLILSVSGLYALFYGVLF